MWRPHWILIVVGLLVGCAQDASRIEVPPGCNPLASEWDCLLPFPSDVFLVDDPELPSGRRVELPLAAQPEDRNGRPFNPLEPQPADGFSHISQILAVFPESIDASSLTFHTELEASLTPDCSTQLIRAATGERVLHFAELDPRSDEDERRALLIRPQVRLESGERYVVAIHGLRRSDGRPATSPDGFRRLRDAELDGAPAAVAELADRYDRDVFPVLASAGIDRAELQLAWDFTTRTEDDALGDLLTIRDDLIDRFEREPPTVTIDEVMHDVDERVARRVNATMTVPAYLDDYDNGHLRRDASGIVVADGTFEVPFTVVIPHSVAQRSPGSAPAPVIQFGHGFFGSRDEAADEAVAELAQRAGAIVVAADWHGMNRPSLGPILTALNENPSDMFSFVDRVHQAMAHFIALTFVVRGPLATEPALSVDDAALFDPNTVFFYGLSMGHILGGTYVALSPHIRRAALGVGGAGFSFIMFRSVAFAPFLLVLGGMFPDALDQQKLIALAQTSLDPIDPITSAPRVSTDILLQIGVGDPAVPNLASHLHARALGIEHLTPAPRSIPALPTTEGPHDGSAIVEFDFQLGFDPIPGDYADLEWTDNEVHEGVRRLEPALNQLTRFFSPEGQIEHMCDGACDPL